MNKIKTIRQDDPGFYITDGLTVAGRADFVVTPDCPPEHALKIRQAWTRGWLKSEAHMLESEYMWEKLAE
jgi:hypothetical protein